MTDVTLRYLTAAEAEEYTRLSNRELKLRTQMGEIAHLRPTRNKRLYTREDLDAYLESKRREAKDAAPPPKKRKARGSGSRSAAIAG